MTNSTEPTTIEQLSRVSPDDFQKFLSRKKISSVCSECGEATLQTHAQTIEDENYLRLLEWPIMNVGTTGISHPAFFRTCSNCHSIKPFGALAVYKEIAKYNEAKEA